jgi:radical SAM protein with 4Fe4S-binding SPASM domain
MWGQHFIRLAKEAGVIEAQINSNGALLSDDLSRFLIETGLDRIKLSIDGVTPAVYDSIRKGTTYEETVPKVIKFIEIRNSMEKKLPSVQVQMVYMESNQKEVINYIRFWEDKANRIGFSRYRGGQNRIGEKGRTRKLGKRFPCHQLWQRLVVLWDGTVLMCCGDHQARNPMGRIIEKSLNDIWKSEELDNIRRLHLEGRYDEIPACVDCEVNYT